MIIVQFHGGLGNQMYEYAFYTYLKTQYPNITIKADTDRYIYEKYKEHNGFELERIFENVQIDRASTKEILLCGGVYERHEDGILDIVKKTLWNRVVRRIINKYKKSCIVEQEWNDYSLHHGFSDKDNIWLSGYWANRDVSCFSDFQFKITLDAENMRVLHQIETLNSVSIHVRKGDYVTCGLEMVNIEYYRKAISILEQRFPNLTFFVFSDDKEYIKNHFSFLENYYVVDLNSGEDSYKDMQLMSNCKYNIICNSTFSTWAALLNKKRNKVVIAPKDYMREIHADNLGEWIGIDF